MMAPGEDSDETIMVVSFRLKPDANVETFLRLSKKLETWLHQQPGFLTYNLYRSAKGWTDTLTWSDLSAANNTNTAFAATELARDIETLVEPDYRSFKGHRVNL